MVVVWTAAHWLGCVQEANRNAPRFKDQSVYMSYALPDKLARKPSEYMTSGRFFASVVSHEGEKMARIVTDFLGDSVLMYSSDYPHAESRFPESTNKVLEWKFLRAEVLQKILWDNATRCFGEP
jgi:predicted TIM-barrel fold metal-dependent hydrolase